MAQQTEVQHQIASVLDLNKCLGCQTCTIACKTLWTDGDGMEYMWWNTVNTQPGMGTPRDWENKGGGWNGEAGRQGQLPTKAEFGEAWQFNHEQVYYEGKGSSVFLQPQGGRPSWGPNWDEDQGGGEYPNSYYFYLPRICNHCTNPACLAACPRSAIYKRPEDGIVLVDEDLCHGYRFCVEACPYKKIYFNFQRDIAQKCIFCFPRIEKGVPPACARQCSGRLRFIGFLDDEDGPIYKLVNEWKVALRLHAERGTQPNVFYIPPLSPPRIDENGEIDESTSRIPPGYLEYLFGAEVHQALETLKAEREKVRRGEKSELMDLLIVYKWHDLFGPFDKDPATV